MANTQSQKQIKPDQILEILIRRIWILILPICFFLTIGIIITFISKKTYIASTSILVQPQRVPQDYIRSIVSADINQRLSTISQQILSMTNLEKIIDEFDLFPDASDMYLEDKIRSMRKRINVRFERVQSGAEAFSISFEGDDPEKVMKVANTLASFFMDENLKAREAQAIGTSEFLESELEKTRAKLEEHEKKLSEYRTKYLGGLPDELESNLRTLDRLQLQLTDKQNELRNVKNSLNLLTAENKRDDSGQTVLDDSALSDNENRLMQAKSELETLLLKYSEKHPDVKKTVRIIENLEKAIAESKKDVQEGPGKRTSDTNNLQSMSRSVRDPQSRQAALMAREIENIQSDIQKIQQQMNEYQNRVENTPNRELELQSLQRDYGNIRDVYNSLLDRRLEAELAVNMEKKQKGEQFRILDYARLPEKPIKPDVRILFLVSIAAGLGLGGGIVFLLEFLDTSIRREDEIEADLGLPILAILPPLEILVSTRKKLFKRLALLMISLYTVGLIGFFLILNVKGIDKTVGFIKEYLTIS